MMPLQRARGAESRVRNKLSNGPPRAQSNGHTLYFTINNIGDKQSRVFCDVGGMRQLPGICRYPAKRTSHIVNSRWHRG